MFEKIKNTQYAPDRFLLVWDGTCGFCKYWVIRWKILTGDAIRYEPYQKAATRFPDIDVRHFREAVRLIGPDGTVYSGPHAAYKSMSIGGKHRWLCRWYESSAFFRWLSDVGYQWVADHRVFAMKLTKWLVGKDPRRMEVYWMYYLMILVAVVLLVLF